jgi:hypothetical protein
MKWLLILLLYILMGISVRGAEPVQSGSFIEVASVSGALEIDKPSVLAIEIRNIAPAEEEAKALGLQKGEAMGIAAELRSLDDRIKVLSSPQVAGSLLPGENRSLEFMALAEGAQAGIYPLEIILSYSRLSQVLTSGDAEMPDFLFEYENSTQKIPLEAKVIIGPKIRLEEVRGKAYPGKVSEIEILFVNQGDAAANDLRIQASPQTPFLKAEITSVEERLEPKASTRVHLKVLVEANSTSGSYALPFTIFYRDGGIPAEGGLRSEEMAALISIQRDSIYGWLIMPLAGALLLIGGYVIIREFRKGKKKRKSLRS